MEALRISGEIDLIAAQNGWVDGQIGSTPTFIFNAPVGMVQSGPGSYGSVTQHIDTGAKEALEKALDQVNAALKDVGCDQPFNALEVNDLVANAKFELMKDVPNVTRLRAFVSGIGGAIAFAPKLKAAYDTLKWAGNFVGVALP